MISQLLTKKRNSYLLLLALCCFVLFFTLRGGSLPFVGVNAWNFNTYSLIAHNYVHFGYIETSLAPIVSISDTLPTDPEYYLHHPQLLSLLQSVFFFTLGESYFTARLPVVLASVGCVVLVFFCGRILRNNTFALLAATSAALVPSLIIFGRMIGQEALVLFFVLGTLFSLLMYQKTKRRLWLVLSLGVVVLGGFSDWPMVYFVFSLFPYLYIHKQLKLYVFLLAAAIFTSVIVLQYIIWIMGGFSDLLTAFMVRSPGEVLTMSLWYVYWPITILLRIFIYFNPLIVVSSIIGTYITFLAWRKRHDSFFFLLVSLLMFGSIHIMLYPEGSFGHAYWIIYLLPFFVFSSALTFEKLLKRKLFLGILMILSLAYFLIVEDWKTGETRANLFRYYLASAVSSYIPQYSTVYINKDSVIDPDLLSYSFMYEVKRLANGSIPENRIILYSCRVRCSSDVLLRLRATTMDEIVFSSPDATVHLFTPYITSDAPDSMRLLYEVNETSSKSLLKKIYVSLKEYLSLPQL